MNQKKESLSTKQRAHLRRLAHHARPVVHIGKSGLTEASLRTVEEAFTREELLKVKVLEGAPAPARETATAIAEKLEGVEVVQVMGRIVTLYRRHLEKPRIVLP